MKLRTIQNIRLKKFIQNFYFYLINKKNKKNKKKGIQACLNSVDT